MVDGIFARVGPHDDLHTMTEYATIPIINALSDLYHPTQILADLLTLHAMRTTSPATTSPLSTLPGTRIAWIGDGNNNILHEMLVTYPKLGLHLSYACPQGYEPLSEILAIAEKDAKEAGVEVLGVQSPEEAIKAADVVVTDTWVSMGQEEEKERRMKAFEGFTVSEALVKRGGGREDWKFLHCLPRKGLEVTDEVFYGPRSWVWEEAENRKWSMIGVVEMTMIKKEFSSS